MRPMHRIPSSIRVRRSDVDSTPTGYVSSADAYAGPQTTDGVQRPRTRTPSQPAPADDYFGMRSLWRGSASSGAADADRRSRATPASERRYQPDEDDDELLREEMRAVRRVIHDENEREHAAAPSRLTASSDYPPIRLSDESMQPHVPVRTSSRRPGAVEGLAMRHHKLRKEERRRRREQAASQSTTSSHSSDPQRSAADEPQSQEAAELQPPPHHRNLSDVQEEQSRSQINIPQAGPSIVVEPAPEQEDQGGAKRARRNTIADDGLMATSRRLYDTLLRRRSERNEDDRPLHASADEYASSYPPESSRSSSSDMHEDEVVDYLDVVDPEVATVTALQNVGNSIFFPPIPRLYNRRPTISLPAAATRAAPSPEDEAEPRTDDIELAASGARTDDASGFGGLRRVTSLASLVPRRKKRAAPSTEQERRKHIREWAEMDEEERNELDEHVRMLLTKKARFKRAARGFGRYVRTPHGLIITIYAFSITFWGTAICLFLLKWIDVGNAARQRYWVEICDQILCALFTAVGLGFAPFRAVDTYRMVQIAHYHHLTWKRRRQLQLPELKDKNELPRAAPRLGVAQMTNTMLVKSGLRKPEPEPEQVESSAASEARGAPDESDESWERLDNVASHHSEAGEVEQLKFKRRNKHPFLHRHHRKSDTSQASGVDGEANEDAKDKAKGAEAAHPGYANKDGILPLGQLKRNASIASELPRDFEDVVVLTPKQQANLEYQQRKFHASHTFYRYRETVTHRPFELNLMIAIVILLDCHSCLQASLGGTTWGIYYKNRPTSVTATIIAFSLSCNAVAGLLIWWGGSRTKKNDEVQRLLAIALEEEALRKIRKRQRKQQALEQQQQQQTEAGEKAAEQPKLECIQEH